MIVNLLNDHDKANTRALYFDYLGVIVASISHQVMMNAVNEGP